MRQTPAQPQPMLPTLQDLGAPPPVEIPAPVTPMDALAQTVQTGVRQQGLQRILAFLAINRERNPEIRTVVINPGDNGSYQTLDQAKWTAKSIGVLNPGSAPVYIGIGGISATSAARAPSCPGQAALVLPVQAGDLLFGCDAATLAAGTAVIYVFRYHSLQPLMLGGL